MYEVKTLLPEFDIELPTCMYSVKNVNLAADACGGGAAAAGSSAGADAIVKSVASNNNGYANHALNSTAVNTSKRPECVLDLDDLAKDIDRILKSSAEGAAIKQRQDKVSKQLDELKKQLADIRKTLATGQKAAATSPAKKGTQEAKAATTAAPQKPTPQAKKAAAKNQQQDKTKAEIKPEKKPATKTETKEERKLSKKQAKKERKREVTAFNFTSVIKSPPYDIVINGHPKFVPYSLLAIKNVWKKVLTMEVKSFTHSSYPDIGREAWAFVEGLKRVAVNPENPKVRVTLIWKDCEHTEMISSPTMYVPIYGEVNILRHLSRIGPDEFNYEKSDQCNEIDSILDICYQLLRCKTPKLKQELIMILTDFLDIKTFFMGNKPTIADIAVHSTFKRIRAHNDKDLTPMLVKWRHRIRPVTLL